MYKLFVAPFLVLLAYLVSFQTASAASVSYRYDNLNRLVGVTYDNGMSIGYSYDATGNFTRIARGTGGADVIPPVVTAFGLPAESNSLVVAINPFTATDNVAVTGYCVVQTNSPAGCSWSAIPPTSYTFASGTANGWYTLYAFARDAAGNSSAQYAADTQLNMPQKQLTVTIQGLYGGGGSVNSNPSGIACSSGTCSANYANGTQITLIPSANDASAFSSWSGDCSGTGNCEVSLITDKSATASFSLIPKARVAGIPYGTLSSAYQAVGDNGVLEAQSLVFVEDLSLNRNVVFTLMGGYFSDYNTFRTGYTTLQGRLTVGTGTIKIDRLIIK
ncbi:YD repeat-containing protein [Trichlorobacter thiogenes]|uniref:YD repeat-containing protein n=1 Tax=Trichlorobacter thiogenes TaxID=115783 RepID=A0A1T4PB29_9BACT|nr:RHS repeat protein [Trichlorobacter thiogenes]SJZ88712.1 YD repeat-containing protein [Trichlorobacter thiogenes]